MFDSLYSYFLKYMSHSSSEMDGVEAIGFLYVIECFIQEQLNIHIDDYEKDKIGTISDKISSTASMSSLLSIGEQEQHILFILKLLLHLRYAVIKSIQTYTNAQIDWISMQHADPKKTGIFQPFLKFPSFINQIHEMCGGMEFSIVKSMYTNLCAKLFEWLDTITKNNEKYADASKIQNYAYFEESMKLKGIPAVNLYVSQAIMFKNDALSRYVNWMLSYEMPILLDIGKKVELANSKIGRESGGLELYVKRLLYLFDMFYFFVLIYLYNYRVDALKIVKEIDAKKIEKSIAALYTRLEKHLGHPESKVQSIFVCVYIALLFCYNIYMCSNCNWYRKYGVSSKQEL